MASAVALSVAVGAPTLAPSAGAVISNPGNLRVSMHLSMYTPSFTVAGMSARGSGAATVHKNGLIQIPQSSLSFAPVKVQLDLPSAADPLASSPSAVTVQAVATSDFTGGIDPNNGSAFLVGNIQQLWSFGSTMPSCPVGPFRIIVRTNSQGGIAYSSQSGTVTMVDPGFTVDAIPTAASGCEGLESSVNAALSLPITTTTTTTADPRAATTTTTIDPYSTDPPVPSVLLSLTFSPAPRAAVAPPPPPPNRNPGTTTRGTAATPPAIPNFETPPPDYGAQASGNPGGNNNNRNNYNGDNNGGNNVRRSTSKKVRHPDQHKKQTARKPVRRGAGLIKVVPRTGGKRGNVAATGGKPAAQKPVVKPGEKKLTFVAAAFTKRSASALSTALNLLGLLGLLVFTALALWLVSSEVSSFSAGQKRRRMHRIAGITR